MFSQYVRLAELDEVLVGGPRWQAADIQVGLTQLLRPSLAAAVGAGAGRSHRMGWWSIGLLGTQGREEMSQPPHFISDRITVISTWYGRMKPTDSSLSSHHFFLSQRIIDSVYIGSEMKSKKLFFSVI